MLTGRDQVREEGPVLRAWGPQGETGQACKSDLLFVCPKAAVRSFPGGKPVCALHPFLIRSLGLDLNVSHASHGIGVTEAYAVLSAPVISSPTTECLLELQNFIKMHILIGIFG